MTQRLADRAVDARAHGDDAAAARLDVHRRVLERAREEGVETAFAELGPDKAPGQATGGDYEGRRLARLPGEFVDAHTWTASRRLVEEHPDLLDKRVTDMLVRWVADARARGDDSAAQGFEKELRVLERTREEGIGAAFAPLRPDHKGLDPPEVMFMPEQARKAEENYRRSGNTLALDIAVAAWEEFLADPALETAPPGIRWGALNDLALDYMDRYEATGWLSDLDAAIECLQQIADEEPQDSPKRFYTLGNFAVALQRRYARRGDLADLEQSLRALESAAEAATGSPEEPGTLNNLSTGLVVWYRRTGDLAALDRAVETLRHAATLAPRGSADEQECQNNLGMALHIRWGHTGAPADLDAAVAAFEQALAVTAKDAPRWPSLQANLGEALQDRYKRSGETGHLDAVVAAFEEALERTPLSAPDWPRFARNLASGLRTRYLDRSDPADLDRAIAVVERGLTTPGTADTAAQHDALGRLLVLQFYAAGRRADPSPATEALRIACQRGLDESAGETLGTAQFWDVWAADRGAWQEAAEAGGCGLEAMTRLFRTQLVREHKEAWLQAAIGLPMRAAYALARSSDVKAAAVALERGRALLLSEILERDRADVARLADLGHAGLVRRYRLTADRLTELERADRPNEPGQLMTPAQSVEALREVRAELNARVAKIRTVTGYERFLGPRPDHRSQAPARPATWLTSLNRPGGQEAQAGETSDRPFGWTLIPRSSPELRSFPGPAA